MIRVNNKFINRSGIMVVADPCVIEDTGECAVFSNCRKGVWHCEFVFDYNLDIKEFKVTHEDSRIMLSTVDEAELDVYSGQVGVFDKDNYRNDDETDGLRIQPLEILKDGDLWYCAMNALCIDSKYGGASYSYGCLADIDREVCAVQARKSIDKQYVEFQIKWQH